MRLLRFHIKKHLLLQDLDLQFDRPGRLDTGQYVLDFLVGLNGSGKSTLLRAIMQVFIYLENGGERPSEFEIEYELDNSGTPIVVNVSEMRHLEQDYPVRRLRVKDKIRNDILFEQDIQDGSLLESQYLPKKKIVYSTGSESAWDRLLDVTNVDPSSQDASADLLEDAVQRAIKELPGSMVQLQKTESSGDEPPFWLMRAASLPIITLCGLLAHLASKNRLLKDVIEALGIEAMTGFSLRFRLHAALLSPSELEQYEKLENKATNHLQQGADHLLYFDLSEHSTLVGDFLKEFNGSFELYRTLEKIAQPNETGQPTLQQVSIFLQRTWKSAAEDEQDEVNTIPDLFLLDWLSDGEQSFLGRMALLAMLDTDDSLILLDEPEVHFNDYWKREVVYLLDKVMSSHTNHLMITTHSSILLTDVTDNQITVLFKDEDGIARQRRPGVKTFGADPSEIMTVLFQAEIPSGRQSTDALTVAVDDGDKATVEGYLQSVGPGMWRFRLKQRLGEIDASSD